MSDFSMLQSSLQGRIKSRSMGVKLIVVCGLALLMTIPAFFVSGLVDDRSKRKADVIKDISDHVGGVQTIFYLLLLSFAERIGFDYGFLLAGTATVSLLSLNASWIFVSRLQGARALVVFTLLYIMIYFLLRLEDNALLVGSIASFLVVAAAMYLTRRIDWYSSLPATSAPGQTTPLAPGNTL